MIVETYVAAKFRVATQQNLKTKVEVKAFFLQQLEKSDFVIVLVQNFLAE